MGLVIRLERRAGCLNVATEDMQKGYSSLPSCLARPASRLIRLTGRDAADHAMIVMESRHSANARRWIENSVCFPRTIPV
jgi:hypothetical protein